MSRDKQNIKTTDWLIRGIPEEQLKREKREAIMSAYLQLYITYDEETKIDFDATAEKMVAEGYVKSSDVAEEIFAEIEKCSEVALMNGHIETPILCIGFGVIAELKKKYIGKDTNVLAILKSQEQRIKELAEENERLKTDLEIRNMKRASIFEIADAFDRGRTAGVRKMRELIYERLDISVEGYSSEEVKSDVRDMVYQIAKEMLEGEK